MAANFPTSSGSYFWQLSLAESILDAFGRIQIRPAAIGTEHVITARRKMNILLSDWSNLGVNLWTVSDDIQLPLIPGVLLYDIPPNTVDLLDCYIRQYTASSSTLNLGNALVPMLTMAGVPMVTQVGDPMVLAPGSGTLSCTQGSQVMTLYWPGHGLGLGSPIFWGCPVSIGGLSLLGFAVASAIIDADNVQFLAPVPALESQTLQGATPLFSTTAGSGTITVVQPGHNLVAGDTYPVPIPTTVGGLTLSGSYTVAAVQSSYQFSFASGGFAATTDNQFENGGKINVAPQQAGTDPIDIFLWPLSRTEYAQLPDKFEAGRPTQYWFDRLISPQIRVWPVPPTGSTFAFIGFRTKYVQDANPISGQLPDMPKRAYSSFVAGLCAALAEDYAADQWPAKLKAAEIAWNRFAGSDVEHVSTYVTPQMDALFR